MDGEGFPWESKDRECQHDTDRAFSTIRGGICFVCDKTQYEIINGRPSPDDREPRERMTDAGRPPLPDETDGGRDE